jgi:hypothetical protein
MSQLRFRFRAVAPSLLPAVVAVVLLAGGDRPARAFVDVQLPTLSNIVREDRGAVSAIAVLKVEKVNREKKAVAYSKVRHLKGTVLGRNTQSEPPTVTHVLRAAAPSPNRPLDAAGQDRLNDAILDYVAEGKTVVVFQRYDMQLVCVGPAWYGLVLNPVGQEDRPHAAASDARYSRVFCGDVGELITAVTDLLAGKEVMIPRAAGTNQMLIDRTAPIRRGRADRAERNDDQSPFRDQAAWATHRGGPQRAGSDGGPGP